MSESSRISVYVQPRASKTTVVGLHDGAVKIRLAAPPVDGAANAALIEFIAGQLRLPKSNIRIVAGQTSRRKVLEIHGASKDAVFAALGVDVGA